MHYTHYYGLLNETYKNVSNEISDKNTLPNHHNDKQYFWLLLLIIQVWIFVGNFVVVLLILKYKTLFNNNTTNIIFSLSITDLLLSTIVLPFTLYNQVNNSVWDLGFNTCVLWLAGDMQLTTTSILHLCAISFERYLSIAKPIVFRRTMKKRIRYLITASWVLSLVFVTLPFIIFAIIDKTFVLVFENNRLQCGYFSMRFLAYATLITFWLPLVFMIMFGLKTIVFIRKAHKVKLKRLATLSSKKYSKMFHDTKNNRANASPQLKIHKEPIDNKVVFSLQQNNELSVANGVHHAASSQNCSSSKEENNKLTNKLNNRFLSAPAFLRQAGHNESFTNSNREIQAQKTLLIVLVVFVVSYFPLFTLLALYVICNNECKFLNQNNNETYSIVAILYYVTTWLGYSSSGMNPCLYAFLNNNFKMALRALFSSK